MDIVSATNSSAMVDKIVQMEQMKLAAVSVLYNTISVLKFIAEVSSDTNIIIIV